MTTEPADTQPVDSPAASVEVPAEFSDWYEGIRLHLTRAADDLLEDVQRFIADWSEVYGFRCERGPMPRVKTPDRTYAKCTDKGVTNGFDRLLADPYPVGDLVGVRFVVRSRADVELVLAAVQNQGSLPFYEIENLGDEARSSGYRAVHINGVIRAVVRDVVRSVPFEVQLKTLAQDAWGYYTHDTAYVPTETNQHPRFAQVRGLQRILAEQLHTVDLLQQHVEVVAEEIANEVAAQADPTQVMFATVQQVMKAQYDVTLSVSEAQRLVRLARDMGLDAIDAFADAVAPDSPEAVAFAESYRADRGRSPASVEIAAELLRRLGASEG